VGGRARRKKFKNGGIRGGGEAKCWVEYSISINPKKLKPRLKGSREGV